MIFFSEMSAAMVKLVSGENRPKMHWKRGEKIKIWTNIYFLQVLGKAGADNEEPSNFASPGPVCGYIA